MLRFSIFPKLMCQNYGVESTLLLSQQREYILCDLTKPVGAAVCVCVAIGLSPNGNFQLIKPHISVCGAMDAEQLQ